MNKGKALFFVFCLGVFFSCTKKEAHQPSGKLNGLHKFYYPQGELYLEINYRDSLPHGIFRQYFKTGILFEESEYRNGIKHGRSRTFHPNGRLSTETPYDSGRIHGIKKKYRGDGQIAFEAPYYYDHPCTGLREFYLSGRLVEKYPGIVITAEDNLLRNNQYTLHFSLSDKNQRVEFYQGELTDGKYISGNAKLIRTENGTGSLYYMLPPGDFVMEKLNIIAKVKTDLNNFYITQCSYNLAAENR
jgi:hypothetical protein